MPDIRFAFLPRHSLAIALTLLPLAEGSQAAQTTENHTEHRVLRPMLTGNIDRPLRYTPDGRDFVIVNGSESFNRPLYGAPSAFRVDAGDRPQFSFYLPGRGGNLQLGFATKAGMKWLHDAQRIEARYRNGTMVYEIRDPLLGNGSLRLTALAPKSAEGLLLKMENASGGGDVEVFAAFGGVEGRRGGRDGDIGCEAQPVREFFRFRPEYCRNNQVVVAGDGFTVKGSPGSITALVPGKTEARAADATRWDNLEKLAGDRQEKPDLPVALAKTNLLPGQTIHIGFQYFPPKKEGIAPWTLADLPALFERELKQQTAIAGHVKVTTPDPFVNAAVAALNVAADGVWDDQAKGFTHGAVAWRIVLLGWRGAYSGDVLGWPERTRAHVGRFAARQNTSPVPAAIPPPEPAHNLSRNENALHSNGDMSKSHYDMNLVAVDAIFRHILWTGDMEYARQIWPVIERHMAWERRLFRREFGPEKLPLYEAYCCIWASDALAYSGGGATHSSAYNLFHNRMAARLAKLLGHDPSIYEREAELLERGMQSHLWLKDRGWFAEWKDLLGEQLTHPEAAAWTFYHTVDSEVPSPMQAWQMSRFVDTRLPHFPLRGPGVPEGTQTISTTSWMPYDWSLNNVVLAETMHTALAQWQAGRPDAAYSLFKGAILDSMYLGICPGNVGMCTWFDINRREAQRDFSDGVGAMSRTVMEGLFGITPDLLAGEINIRPGFPAAWNQAAIEHPSFGFQFVREGLAERFTFQSRFAKPVALRLVVPALRDEVESVTANGAPAAWTLVSDSVGSPRIQIVVPPAAERTLEIRWRGKLPAPPPVEVIANAGQSVELDAGAAIDRCEDPQGVLSGIRIAGSKLSGTASGTPGHRTLFAHVAQGKLAWWQPVALDVREPNPPAPLVFTTDWNARTDNPGALESVPMEKLFNENLNMLFKREYLSPRSPFCSLAIPKQGIGSWCNYKGSFNVDDSGLRAASSSNGGRLILPNGVPLATPGGKDAPNVALVSQWDNHPRQITLPLAGRARKIYLLMAGTTSGMQSRFDNGEVVVTYKDGTRTRLPLENPGTWWPIDQDYFIDDYAFARPGPLPARVDLKTGKVRVLDPRTFVGTGRTIPGGAATVLDLKLDPSKELESLSVRAIANEALIGLMSATLERP